MDATSSSTVAIYFVKIRNHYIIIEKIITKSSLSERTTYHIYLQVGFIWVT